MKPREIFTRLHKFVINYDADGQADLFADEAKWKFPFAPEGIPKCIEGWKNIIAASKSGMERSKTNGRQNTDYKPVVIYETEDPEIIFAEFRLN